MGLRLGRRPRTGARAGAISPNAPHSTGKVTATTPTTSCAIATVAPAWRKTIKCPSPDSQYRLDCGDDDYFALKPRKGSWLARNPSANVANPVPGQGQAPAVDWSSRPPDRCDAGLRQRRLAGGAGRAIRRGRCGRRHQHHVGGAGHHCWHGRDGADQRQVAGFVRAVNDARGTQAGSRRLRLTSGAWRHLREPDVDYRENVKRLVLGLLGHYLDSSA